MPTAPAGAGELHLCAVARARAVDGKRVGLIGHSRSPVAAERWGALTRRDFGESVDDMAANFPWQFTGAFQKYAGRWNDLPVDAHLLIALSAPRPVFVTGSTQDQWADPKGESLAQVAASPVYRLLRKKVWRRTRYPRWTGR